MTTLPGSIDSQFPSAPRLPALGNAARSLSAARLEQVRGITAEIFPGPIEVEFGCDPEDEANVWWDVWVNSAVEYAALRELRARWYEAIRQLAPDDPTVFSLQVRRQ